MTPVNTDRQRRRRVWVPLALAVAMGSAVLTPAYAADPEVQRREVQRRLAAASQHLEESSAALSRATADYEAAQAQLPGAEAALAQAQRQFAEAQGRVAAARAAVVAARAEDAAAAQRLAAAEEQVRVQEGLVGDATSRIDGRRATMGRIAVQAYQQGPMADLAQVVSVLESASVEEFNARVTYVQSVLGSETTIVAGIADERAGLANERVHLEELREVARRLREEAAAALARTQQAQAEAEAAEVAAAGEAARAAAAQAEVHRLVAAQEGAFRAAETARAEDAAAYAALEAERRAIEALIAERVRQAKARAEQERRDREARERAEAQARASSRSPGGRAAPAPAAPAPAPSTALSRPVSGRITSSYGMRVHPITKVYKLHDGTDFGVGCGTPIRAAAGGEVVWATTRGAYGQQVLVDHGVLRGVSVMTSYSHLSRYAVGSGANVSRGDVIGYVGSTGYSTGCHLHWMVYVDGGTTNPVGWL